MAGLGLSITVRIAAPSSRESVKTVADRIMRKRLDEAVKRIQARWPIDTGLSKRSFKIVRVAQLRYRLDNDAARKGRKYAGYVHRSGNPTPLRLTLIPRELQRAQEQIAEDLEGEIPNAIRDDIRRLARSSASFRALNNRLGRIRL